MSRESNNTIIVLFNYYKNINFSIAMNITKKLLLSFLILLQYCALNIFSQSQDIRRIGLVHPTQGNISNITYLINNKLIESDSIEIIGIFHYTEKQLIENSRKLMKENNLTNIKIVVVEADIPTEHLFEQNNASEAFKKIFEMTDAMVFLGGDDIPPSIYGEETFLTTELITKGRNWEISFMFHLIGGSQNQTFTPFLESNPHYPVIGICLGMQQMNVASGGTLYQDIPFQIYGHTSYESILNGDALNAHKNYRNKVSNEERYSTISFHPIRITKGSFLDFPNSEKFPLVASYHHQAVKRVGKNLKVVATSLDGKVIEALQHTKYDNVYGIQFHTDFSILYEKGREFMHSSTQKTVLSENIIRFYKEFWMDFSSRLQRVAKTK